MAQEPPRTVIEASGQVATDVVAGLRQQPALLAIVVLNIVMVTAMFWFIGGVNDAVKANRDALMAMVSRCLNHQGIPQRENRP